MILFLFMIAEQSLECEAPASLWITPKIRWKQDKTTVTVTETMISSMDMPRQTKAAQECRTPKSGLRLTKIKSG